MKIAIKYGCIAGIASVALTILFYVTGLNLANMWSAMIAGILMLIIFAVVVVMSVKAERKINGGHIGFKEAFINGFICALTAYLISTVYSFIHYNYIEPDFFDKMAEMMQRSMASYGVPQEQIDKAIDDLLQNKDKIKTFDYTRALIGVAFCAAYAAIVGLVVKKEKTDEYGTID